jgi:hypothetical protein
MSMLEINLPHVGHWATRLNTRQALTVPDHAKFQVGRRRQSAPKSVVEKTKLALQCAVTVTDHPANSGRVTRKRSPF